MTGDEALAEVARLQELYRDLAASYCASIDWERGCCHSAEEIRTGIADEWTNEERRSMADCDAVGWYATMCRTAGVPDGRGVAP